MSILDTGSTSYKLVLNLVTGCEIKLRILCGFGGTSMKFPYQ